MALKCYDLVKFLLARKLKPQTQGVKEKILSSVSCCTQCTKNFKHLSDTKCLKDKLKLITESVNIVSRRSHPSSRTLFIAICQKSFNLPQIIYALITDIH